MLRYQLSAGDLARVRVADEVQLPVELALSVQVLRGPADTRFARWRRQALAAVRDPAVAVGIRLLGRAGMSGQAGCRLAPAVLAYRAAAIAPYEEQIRRRVDEDRALRAAALLDGGVAGLFDSLRPAFQWRAPVLEVRSAVTGTVRPGGRGLMLVPSYFCRTPTPFAGPDRTPGLVYPVEHDGPGRAEPDLGALRALVGATRARMLVAVTGVMTSRQLASRLSVSESSVSEHTSVLRQAGLIASRRHRNTLLHMRTPLGSALVGGERPMVELGPPAEAG